MKQARKLNIIDHIVLFFTILAAAAIALSWAASFTDPRTLWPLAFFGLAYPPLLIANIILVLYWFVRFSKIIFIPLVCILIGWNILVRSFNISSPSSEGTKQNPDYLRLITYNVHSFTGVGDSARTSTRHAILQVIGQQNPDVVCMEEFFTRKTGPNAMIDSMKKVMNSTFFYSFAVDNINYEGNGIAVFSKYPIVNKGMITLSDKSSANQCIFIDIKKADKTIRVYTVHLQSIHFQPEDYQVIDSVSDAKKSSMHDYKRILGKLKKAFLKRSEQVYIVKNHAKTSPYPYIIAGDFNDTPASFAVNKMAEGLLDAFRDKGNGFGATYNGDFPNYQIDYILADPQFTVKSYFVLKKKLSDHYPVRADLMLQ